MTERARAAAEEFWDDWQFCAEDESWFCDQHRKRDFIAFVADAVAQAVKERDERIAELKTLADGWEQDWREQAEEIARLQAMIAAKDTALQFAEGAIADAIGSEDGLDGLTGEKILHLCREAREAGTFDQEPFDRSRLPSLRVVQQAEELAQLRDALAQAPPQRGR